MVPWITSFSKHSPDRLRILPAYDSFLCFVLTDRLHCPRPLLLSVLALEGHNSKKLADDLPSTETWQFFPKG